jgi:hypothetical protein
MADRKSFLLRVDREVLDAVQRWANDDLRSLNGQIEFLLRRALREAGRTPKAGPHVSTHPDDALPASSGDTPPPSLSDSEPT